MYCFSVLLKSFWQIWRCSWTSTTLILTFVYFYCSKYQADKPLQQIFMVSTRGVRVTKTSFHISGLFRVDSFHGFVLVSFFFFFQTEIWSTAKCFDQGAFVHEPTPCTKRNHNWVKWVARSNKKWQWADVGWIPTLKMVSGPLVRK